jgi:hypothetical protein
MIIISKTDMAAWSMEHVHATQYRVYEKKVDNFETALNFINPMSLNI